MTAGMSHWGKINAERQQKEAEREAGREAREADSGMARILGRAPLRTACRCRSCDAATLLPSRLL